MIKSPGNSDEVMTDLMYTVMKFIAMYLCKSLSGLYHSNIAVLCMFLFEYAYYLACVCTTLEGLKWL
jgi:hypothetical protein